MRQIKQTILNFKQGRSDKIYEVSLCEVGDNQFVVNFRYGRRGSVLREGTRTASPVALPKAEEIYDKLVQSRISKGYVEGLAVDPIAVVKEIKPANVDDRKAAVLERIREGFNSSSKWRLSRAVWRAGELNLTEAIPLFDGLVGREEMTDYCIAWSLGRMKQPGSADLLQRIASSPKNREHVKQIASQALRLVVDERQRESMVNQVIDSLPQPLGSLLKSGSAEVFQSTFLAGVGQQYSADLLNALYYIDNDMARQTLITAIESVELRPPFFRPLRRLFKAAEIRRDGQMFGLLAHRFEQQPGNFSRPRYAYSSYRLPSLGEDAKNAFSIQTRNYLRRRVWRQLNRMGELGDSNFVPMAVGTLLPYRDDDGQSVTTGSRYDWQTNSYREFHIHPFSRSWAFSRLLFSNSGRFQFNSRSMSFSATDGYRPDSPLPSRSEAAFLNLWQAQPRGLLHLLTDSRCQPVHEFAAPALRGCQEFCDELPLDVVLVLLASKYGITNQLALDLAVARYNPSQPDMKLVLALAQCPLPAARLQAKKWIDAKRHLFFADIDFAYQILTSPFSDTRNVGLESLHSLPTDATEIKALAGRLIAFLQGAVENEEIQQTEIAADVVVALEKRQFTEPLSTVSESVICDLLASELAVVQLFAGSIVLNHETFSSQPTEPILRAMLDSQHAPVRSMGIKIISRLPDEALLNNVEMLVGLTCHPLEDIRSEIRPVIKRLASSHSEFGKAMADSLIRRLLTPGAPEGVPTHTSRVVREDLRDHLSHVTSETVQELLGSRSGPAQELGGLLLPTHIDPAELSVADIVKLANTPVVTVRRAAWSMFDSQVQRIREELATAVRILDSKWDDSREFGFEFFEQRTQPTDLTPEVLISICDSVREDVQQFGRTMITQRFAKQHGPEYLVKLSEHPSTDLQLFASNFLAEYGADDPQRIEKLTPYFVSILSRVNKSRVAKDRVLQFLTDEAIKSREAAETISHVLARISATCAIGDRARTIEAMVQLHETYPDIELPIRLQPVEVR